jgi:hypothetical protein
MKSNLEFLDEEKIGKLTKFLKGIRYFKINLINGPLKEYMDEIDGLDITSKNMEAIINSFIQQFGIDWIIVKLSSDIFELFEKTISQGQIIAIMHKALGIKLSSTERSQLYELRKKIRRYDRFLSYFGVWGKKFDLVLKVLMFGLEEQDATKLEYILDKANISVEKQTIGVDFYTKDVEIFEKYLIRLQIWDISKYNKFDKIRKQYYRGATVAIISFYKDNEESIDLMKTFISELKEKTNLKSNPRRNKKLSIEMPIAIVGLGHSSNFNYKEIVSIAKEIDAQYFDIGDITDKGFEEIFTFITFQALTRSQEQYSNK